MIQIPIPEQYLVQCRYCGDSLNCNMGGVYHRGTAWFKQQKRARSGTNSACLVDWADDWACEFCIYKLTHRIPVDQMELFHLPIDDDAR